mgnify:CR=1 FL=1
MVVHYDDNKDGKFTVSDSVKITELDVSYLKDEAVDISGIEKCTGLSSKQSFPKAVAFLEKERGTIRCTLTSLKARS